jgi:hypothetical protein
MTITPLKSGAKPSLVAELAQVQAKQAAPAGYVAIQLSTKGKVGAPALFHIRNFKTRDIMALALTEESALPSRIVSILSDLVYEDIDVRTFHENEVVETMLLLYAAFYSTKLRDVNFPVEEADLDYLRAQGREEDVTALLTGKWVPKVDIDILQDVDTYDLPAGFSPIAMITDKKTGFSMGSRAASFGDVLIVNELVSQQFADKERAVLTIKQRGERREQMLAQFKRGEAVDLTAIPYISPAEELQYTELQIEKASMTIDVIRAVHLMSFEGRDVSKLPIAEKIALVQDARVDSRIAQKLDAFFQKLHFGLKPQVRMINPITGESCVRDYTFQFAAILQATQLPETDEDELIFDNQFNVNSPGD